MSKPIKLPKKKYIETIFESKGEVKSIKKTEGFWTVKVILKDTLVIYGTFNAFNLIYAEPNSGEATYQAENGRVEMYMDAGVMY